MEIKFRYIMRHIESGNIEVKKYHLSQLENSTLKELSPVFTAGYELLGKSQFTGKIDDDNEEIYGEDIVEVTYLYSGEEITEIANVRWDDTGKGFSPMNWDQLCEGCDLGLEITKILVIGNVYTNPELV